MGKFSFGKLERLTKRHEFDKVLAEGKKKSIGKMFTVFSIPNGLDRKRLGIIASKKVGNAVARTELKEPFARHFGI